jgi:cobalt transporter subunit CbtA
MGVVLASGAIAGLALFAVQHFTVRPLIERAEEYEAAEHTAGAEHSDGEWRPSTSRERTLLTAAATVLSSIGFAALLFGSLALAGRAVDARSGALWGLGGLACFHLAPALGLPPQPPGVPVADTALRQLWWAGTAVATAWALWLILGRRPGRSWLPRIAAGALLLLLPHWIGAPAAPGRSPLPAELMRRFTAVSLATNGMFWILLGSIGGFVHRRSGAAEAFEGPRAGADSIAR